jgi:lipid-A-disaccharide synthase
VVAGEASGDRHGAGVVRAASRIDPSLRFRGVGGPAMAEAGVDLVQSASETAVMGLVEVVGHLPAIWRTWRTVTGSLRREPPDLCLLIDFPDFNLRLARRARAAGVPVLYFVSPQVWAWRRGRVRTIAERVDRMLVILPFEQDLYRRAGLPVEFVGHPLADEVQPPDDPRACRRRLGLPEDGPVVGLLPGSRRGELARHLATMLDAADRLLRVHPRTRFVLPLASTLPAAAVREQVAASSASVQVVEESLGDAVGACDVAAVASGTATLEVGLRMVPLVVVYRTNPLTHALARRFVRVPHIGLVNLVAEREVAPELVQADFTADRLATLLDRFLADEARRRRAREDLAAVRRRLRGQGAYARAAEVLLEMCRPDTPCPDGRVLEEARGA